MILHESLWDVGKYKKKNKSPRRGIEPRSGTRQAPILTIKLSRIGDLLKKLQHCDIMLFRICQMIYQHTFDYVANSNRLCVHIIYIVICNEHFLTSSSNYKWILECNFILRKSCRLYIHHYHAIRYIRNIIKAYNIKVLDLDFEI